jgi:Fur family ferric uptake transcriptional regulator/Fur family peroxide stress response transcriptional regulator
MSDRTDRRLTPQRRAVLEVLRASSDHPTAADIYDRVRTVTPSIGAATVYRSLGVLVESGLALELNLGDGVAARYDANTRRHDHVVCDACGRAVDVDLPVPDDLPATLSARTGFAITSYSLQFRGLCPTCQASTSHLSPPDGEPSAQGVANAEA